MRETSEIIIPIPKARNTHCKVEVNGDDLTGRIVSSVFVYPCTMGIGTFSLIISNALGQYTGEYSAGDVVKFYADNSDASTLQFQGRIDYVKENLSKEGQFLEIEGRHRSYLLTEYLVCHSATSTSPAEILKDIIDKLPSSYGFTYANIAADSTTMDVEWNYKPFWDCVVELCNKSGFDCYVDNDLDFHYFEANSIANEDDAIVEGDNFLKSKEWGTNDYYEKTRVIAMGQDSDGLPIVYTAIDADEGDDIREFFIKDTSANKETKVQNLAEAKLEEVTNRNPQAVMLSFGLETIKPGENIWIIVPRQKIAGQYKIIQITHKFGAESGGWRTESVVEEKEFGISGAIQAVSQKSSLGIVSDNVNKFNYSYNFDFEEDIKVESHDGTKVSNSKLLLDSDSATDGTWISIKKTADDLVSYVELRVKGKDIWDSEFYFSLNDGGTWQQIDVDDFSTLITPTGAGKDIKIKVKLSRPAGWNMNPEIESLVLLYK